MDPLRPHKTFAMQAFGPSELQRPYDQRLKLSNGTKARALAAICIPSHSPHPYCIVPHPPFSPTLPSCPSKHTRTWLHVQHLFGLAAAAAARARGPVQQLHLLRRGRPHCTTVSSQSHALVMAAAHMHCCWEALPHLAVLRAKRPTSLPLAHACMRACIWRKASLQGQGGQEAAAAALHPPTRHCMLARLAGRGMVAQRPVVRQRVVQHALQLHARAVQRAAAGVAQAHQQLAAHQVSHLHARMRACFVPASCPVKGGG